MGRRYDGKACKRLISCIVESFSKVLFTFILQYSERCMKLSYKHTQLLLLYLFLINSYRGIAQEICNNGKDDDGDGLIDLYDPDCQCHFTVTDNLLLNGSFESYDHCPVY